MEMFLKIIIYRSMEALFFDTGWVTKTFTTLVLADMMTQGIVNIHDSIEMYLPK